MTSDGRKGLVFSYNVCNLPKEVTSNRFRLGGKESQTFGSLDLGKVDFGAVSKATGMIPEELGLFGAGIVQVLSGTSRKEFINLGILSNPLCAGFCIQVKRPYGDDPKDQEQILKGYEYYKNKR